MARKGIVVAIDGPAGAGKSTVARRVAEALGYTLVDTGAIYRAVALLAQRAGVAPTQDAVLGDIVRGLNISFELAGGVNRMLVSGEDVTGAIRTPAVSMLASTVSARPTVREGLLPLQRKLAGEGGAVLEGRDIGTVVCPDAAVKIYLDASPEERARRRHAEEVSRGKASDSTQVLADVKRRDAQDQGRALAPLKPAPDALRIDSTALSIDQVVAKIVAAARKAAP
ncbi:MAG: (d)CMP kinase [Deltaproteobacteria bacterium]|nr:(d)CMP kinase [Deltaproteobacteria bacterium]